MQLHLPLVPGLQRCRPSKIPRPVKPLFSFLFLFVACADLLGNFLYSANLCAHGPSNEHQCQQSRAENKKIGERRSVKSNERGII
ncbi:hypothetical protein B0T21DRAFT_360315 [Apiosordaria backusii]|uniref:Uncharacterized protein n=1 Tax=Apiosordaria backusii TaxID=314023 RepID=A0AA40EM47_9PEZI|nr:hypothetical protein B0T21DRAFT_360315 [Apiosordaria backusii]